MKKFIAIALVLAFTSAAGFAIAGGKDGACGGKKCPAGKHMKKDGKHSKKEKISEKVEAETKTTK